VGGVLGPKVSGGGGDGKYVKVAKQNSTTICPQVHCCFDERAETGTIYTYSSPKKEITEFFPSEKI
jgi:hypothetical protein